MNPRDTPISREQEPERASPPKPVPAPIHLPFPPSVNAIWRAVKGRNIKAKAYRQWEAEAGTQLAMQRPEKHEGPVSVSLLFFMPDQRRRDLDNLCKPVLDLLVTHQVIQRDDWHYVPSLKVGAIPGGDVLDGVQIIIQPLGDESALRKEAERTP